MMVDRLDPLVIRMYDPHSTASLVKRVLGYELEGAYMIVGFDGWTRDRDGAGSAGDADCAELGARDLGREPGERWWNHRYDFYYPPLGLHLPLMYGTVETVSTFANIERIYHAKKAAIDRRLRPRRRRLHRPLLALVPVGREPLRPLRGQGRAGRSRGGAQARTTTSGTSPSTPR